MSRTHAADKRTGHRAEKVPEPCLSLLGAEFCQEHRVDLRGRLAVSETRPRQFYDIQETQPTSATKTNALTPQAQASVGALVLKASRTRRFIPPPSRSNRNLAQIHRVVAGTGIMGGDGGLRFFPDEAFLIPHTWVFDVG